VVIGRGRRELSEAGRAPPEVMTGGGCSGSGRPWRQHGGGGARREVRVDVASFEDRVASSGGALLRLATMLAGEPYLAEDLVQATLVKAFRQWRRVSAATRPEAYLKAMVVNEYLSWRRRRLSTELPAAVLDDRPTAEDVGGAHAARTVCWQLLGRLPRQQRAVLVLRYYEDLPDEEIARVLGCGVSTVRSNATRALARLRAVVPAMDEEARP
jgi:RNA polymerase sigma-70 factor (sigma-E family)